MNQHKPPETSEHEKIFDIKTRDVRITFDYLLQTIECRRNSPHTETLIKVLCQIEHDLDTAMNFIEQKLK